MGPWTPLNPRTLVVWIASLCFIIPTAQAQNSIRLEDLHRAVNRKLVQSGQSSLATLPNQTGMDCSGLNYPADGTYDAFENDEYFLADNVNYFRSLIWSLDGSGNPQSSSLLLDFADPDMLEDVLSGSLSLVDVGDLAPTLSSIPAPAPFVDGNQPLGQVQADAEVSINEMLGVLDRLTAVVGGGSGTVSVQAQIARTERTQLSQCKKDGSWGPGDGCEGLSEALADLLVDTAVSGSGSVSTGSYSLASDGLCGPAGNTSFGVSVNMYWGSGEIIVPPITGFSGSFLIIARADYETSATSNVISAPWGLGPDEEFRYIAKLPATGGTIPLVASQPPPPYCDGGSIQSYNGWEISTSDIIVIPLYDGESVFVEAGGCTPDLSGTPSETPRELGELSDGPVRPLDCEAAALSNPVSANPVSYATGHKHEAVVDLHVAVPGPDWVLRRDYTSDPAALGGGLDGTLLGRGWTADPFQRILFETSSPSGQLVVDKIILLGYPQHTRTEFVRDPATASFADSSASARWTTGGPTPQYFRKQLLRAEAGSGRQEVWILEEPGQWYMAFYRPSAQAFASDSGSTVNSPAELVGLPFMWFDTYGNRKYFQYWVDFNDDIVRLRSIYLNGSPNSDLADAVVLFDWQMDDTHPEIYGLLDKVTVSRPTEDGFLDVQMVDYVYGAEIATLDEDIGEDTDLVSVVKSERVDATEGTSGGLMHSTFTQYRYHDGGWGTSESDERFAIGGAVHQLKAVIQPAQIEYLAQRRVEAALISSSAEDAVADIASWLLTQADDAAIGTWDAEDYLVLDLAAKIIGYDEFESWVNTEFIQTSCGCGGGTTQGQKIEYSYIDNYLWPSTNEGRTSRESVFTWDFGTSDWTLFREHYTDLEYLDGVPYVRYEVSAEPGTGGRRWITAYEYDSSHNVEYLSTPSWFASSTYQPAVESVSAPIVSAGTAGLRHRFEYTATNRLAKSWIWDTTLGGYSLLEEVEYDVAKPWLVVERSAYRVVSDGTSQDDSDVQTTSYQYFHYETGDTVYGRVFDANFGTYSTGVALAAIGTTVERELPDENGPSPAESVQSYVVFDDRGRSVWSVAEDGSLTFSLYDELSGGPALQAFNADPVAPAQGSGASFDVDAYGELANLSTTDDWGYASSGARLPGDELIQEFRYDLLGRMAESADVGGVHSSIVRELRECPSRPGVLYAAEVAFPHDLGALQLPRFDGPAQIVWRDAGGSLIETSAFTLDENELYEPLDPDGPEYTFETDSSGFDSGQIARSVVEQSLSGLTESVTLWHDIEEDLAYTSAFTYDALGRQLSVTDAVGTITSFEYDVLDRVIATYIARDLTGQTTPLLVQETYYDADPSSSTPSHGVGNGLPTIGIAHTGEGTETRVTRQFYDNRDRLIGIFHPELPTEARAYDNLNRMVASAVHSSLGSNGMPRATTDENDRGMLSIQHFGQRGLLYATEQAIDPTVADSSQTPAPSFLRSDRWYDERGRVIASRSPSAPMEKTVYDAHSRIAVTYVTDHGTTVPGAGSFSDAATVSADRVLEQTEFVYDSQSRLIRTTMSMRPHDALQALNGHLDAADAVRTHTAYFYDNADRVIATAEYGTGNSQFAIDLVDPTFPSPEAPEEISDPEVLVTEMDYNRRGLVGNTTDPLGRVHRTLHDDLGRVVAVIENAVSVDAEDVSWDSSSTESLDHRWTVSGFTYTSQEQDRVTSFVYNGAGEIVKRVAHYPKEVSSATQEGVQVTEYVYGTTAGSSSNPQDSLVASGGLLATVLYPDESTGLPVRDPMNSAYAAHSLRFAYNRLGDLRGRTDQNGTQLVLERDSAGRTTASIADQIDTTDDSANNNLVDGSVRRMETAYDGFGRVVTSTSRDGETGSDDIVNQVQMTYSPLWQVELVHQDHNSAVDLIGIGSDTRTVGYGWDTDSEANHTRLDSITYPSQSSATVTIDYGDTASIEDQVSRVRARRVESLGVNGEDHDPIVSYEYIGVANPAVVKYDAATGIRLSRVLASDGNSETGSYPGLDRFGRVKQQLWVDAAFAPHQTEAGLPAIPPIVQKSYDYSKVHNRLIDLDTRPGAQVEDRDLRFVYDNLHRLVTANRSEHTSTAPVEIGSSSFHWELDTFGNWERLFRDVDASGTYSASVDEVDDWSHNQANELTQYVFSKNQGGQVVYSIASTWEHDDAGNLRRSDRSTGAPTKNYYEYIYDAWNRLVRVKWYKGNGQPVDVEVNAYNGLNWRVSRLADTSQANYNGTDERRLYYYSPSWQLLEEHVDVGNDGSIDRIGQQFWGDRYIDDAVARRLNHDPAGSTPDYEDGVFFYLTDDLFSPIALVRDDGTLAHRTFFTPYGEAEHRWPGDVTADGASTTTDSGIISGLASVTIGNSTYNADAEYNRDGQITSADLELYNDQGARTVLPAGWIDTDVVAYSGSSARRTADNSIGFTGAIFDPAPGFYTMRNRAYFPRWGRFAQRDPAGYQDGQSVYQYVRSSPATLTDPTGLSPTEQLTGIYAVAEERIMLSHQAGKISTSAAVGLLANLHSTACMAFDVVRAEELLEHAHDVAGFKAAGNAMADSAVGLLTLGFLEAPEWMKHDVNEYDLMAGYGGAYLLARIADEVAIGILTGGASKFGMAGKGLLYADFAGSGVGVGQGLWSMGQDGVGWGNSAQVLGGASGFGGNWLGRRFDSTPSTSSTDVSSATDVVNSSRPQAGSEIARASLNAKLSALQNAQNRAIRTRVLPDGRIRYYNPEQAARTQGPTRGSAYVTEWDPSSGRVRSWMESYDHTGNVTRVHPKMLNGQQLDLPHYPPTGKELGL